MLTQRVFEALDLGPEQYAVDPNVRFTAKSETDRALREVLGYRLYRDLRRGWRVTAPNLEQCGLLAIHYQSLEELCAAEDVWQGRHAALVSATPATRADVARTLLDHMRRELAIKVDYLEAGYQERIKQLSSQRLIEPWAIDEDEKLESATVMFPRSRRPNDSGREARVFLSTRSRFGQYLRRPTTFRDGSRVTLAESETIIRDLFAALRVAGLVEEVEPARDRDDVPGYQTPAAAFRWVAGDGVSAPRDRLRIPSASAAAGRANPFFVHFYREAAARTLGLRAREHTAQVENEQRLAREADFKDAKLPILYCSSTMELGVDIAELNVVNMRNVPPTPANYAQRSGRAGRSGQPALVFTYCSSARPHDQYFFKRPELMVKGTVAPPRLDLANEDLVRAHVQAI